MDSSLLLAESRLNRAPIACNMTDMLRAPEGQQGDLGQSPAMQSVPKPNRINSTNVNRPQSPSDDATRATCRLRTMNGISSLQLAPHRRTADDFVPMTVSNVCYRRRIQPVDATVWLNLSAGVW